jgi:hypothetical protein
MRRENEPPGDDYEIRCPRLGSQITFSYCRFENGGLPCFKILDCWFDHFLVEDYLRKGLKDEDWEKAFQKPKKPKLLSLVELIERAKEKKKEDR